jgi:hypothetical protein
MTQPFNETLRDHVRVSCATTILFLAALCAFSSVAAVALTPKQQSSGSNSRSVSVATAQVKERRLSI